MENFTIDVDAEGIATVTFDVPGRRMNTLTLSAQREVGELAAILAGRDDVRGAVIRSGKSSGFCAGADLPDMLGEIDSWRHARSEDELRHAYESASLFSRGLRALERSGKPIAVAIEGLSMGGGFEFVLAAHYRVAVEDPQLQLSLPETGIGLMPGAGATQRLPRLIGINAALPYLLDGKPVALADALAGGVLHATATAGQVVEAARRWVLDAGNPVAPWDEKGFKLPGGSPHGPAGTPFSFAIAARHAEAGDRYPAIGNVLRSVYEGSQVPIDAALRIESRYFLNTARSPQARAMVRTFFTSRQALARLETREPMEQCAAHISAAAKAEAEALVAEGAHPDIVNAIAADAGLPNSDFPHDPAAKPREIEPRLAERRLLYAQSIAAAQCLERGMATDPRQIDADAIARGFPRWTGGPLSLIDVEGPALFAQRADDLATTHPGRFSLPRPLRELLRAGTGPYG